MRGIFCGKQRFFWHRICQRCLDLYRRANGVKSKQNVRGPCNRAKLPIWKARLN